MSINIDRALLGENGEIPAKVITKCIEKHNVEVARLQKLKDYYDGDHAINSRTFSNPYIPNNKIVCNHASYIVNIILGYLFGAPVSYVGDDLDKLIDLYTKIDEDSHNARLGEDINIYGVGYELVYMDEEAQPDLAVLSPINTFLVKDDTVRGNSLFAVTYSEKRDIDNQLKGYNVVVYTDTTITTYLFKNLTDTAPELVSEEPHYFGGIPIIEYKNNSNSTGSFEPVISLIDAYNKLQSDRVNQVEQLTDSFLVLTGASLGDNLEEVSETLNYLRENKIIELDENGKAEWLVKTLNEDQNEVLKNSLKKDIASFSLVPELTDENFIGNSSGVAIKYKLIGFESICKIKERYFKKGLRKRLELINNIYTILANSIDVSAIDIVMTRTLPIDEAERVSILSQTDGLLSYETRIRRFDEELDPEEEQERLNEEKLNNVKIQQEAFAGYDFNEANNTNKEADVDEEA